VRNLIFLISFLCIVRNRRRRGVSELLRRILLDTDLYSTANSISACNKYVKVFTSSYSYLTSNSRIPHPLSDHASVNRAISCLSASTRPTRPASSRALASKLRPRIRAKCREGIGNRTRLDARPQHRFTKGTARFRRCATCFSGQASPILVRAGETRGIQGPRQAYDRGAETAVGSRAGFIRRAHEDQPQASSLEACSRGRGRARSKVRPLITSPPPTSLPLLPNICNQPEHNPKAQETQTCPSRHLHPMPHPLSSLRQRHALQELHC
jgi:hypothetical protein